MSARERDGGVYDARLDAFQEKHAKPEFVDNSKPFIDAINAERIKAENFTEAAIGTKIAPSTANMYESHFQLAKDKFDILYDDKTLEHFSKDEQGMRKWQELVQQLNQEISIYEQVYEDSYGDPSKADGKGVTFSDAEYRRRVTGGNSNEFWEALGFQEITGSDPMETMKSIDSKQHSNLRLDLDNLSWDYDSESRDLLEINDPQSASQLFSYDLAPSKVMSAGEYASDKVFFNVYDTGADGFDGLLNRMRSDDTYVRSAISDYISENQIEDATVMDFVNGSVSPKYPSIDEIVSGFNDKVRSATRNLKKSNVKPSNKPPKKDPFKEVLGSMVESNLEDIGPVSMFTIGAISVVDRGVDSKVQSISFDENGDLYAYYSKPIITETADGTVVDDAPGYYKIDPSSSVYPMLVSGINSKYGPGAFNEMFDRAIE
jgi:hypothetical protein